MNTLLSLLFLLVALAPNTALTGSQQSPLPLHIAIPYQTAVVMMNGKPTVYYELRMTNSASDSVILKDLTITHAASHAVVAAWSGDSLTSRVSRMELLPTDKLLVPPDGGSRVLYIELTLPSEQPAKLTHHLTFETVHGGIRKTHRIPGPVVAFAERTQVVLGSPLRGGPWAAVNEPAWERGHRRVIYTIDGQARIPGRFAIDFIRLDKHGRYAEGNQDVITNWYGYGAEVLAVADGVVASVREDFAESQTLSAHPKYTADQATGNYISLHIGNNNFVLYEHLQPGSIRVKPGQKVRKGEVIGAVGFTGQTTGPHLHFHVANNNSALGAEGVAFAFEKFTQLGAYPDFATFGKAPWIPAAANLHPTSERPAPNTVIEFR